jgi:CRP/FNR family transcriptional regulator, cyclic AMP receptor protein
MATHESQFSDDARSTRISRKAFFSNLSDVATRDLNRIEVAVHCPLGGVIHSEGQQRRGIFIVFAGRVKVSACSSDGITMLLRFAGPGDVLGLAETVAGRPYETTAAAFASSDLVFIERADFLSLLNHHRDVAAEVVRELSDGYFSAIQNLRESGLKSSASRRLARFLLRWCEANGKNECSAALTMTHEEIGQTIGASRETVTRLLSALKKKELIRLSNSLLEIKDSSALQTHAALLPVELRRTAARAS